MASVTVIGRPVLTFGGFSQQETTGKKKPNKHLSPLKLSVDKDNSKGHTEDVNTIKVDSTTMKFEFLLGFITIASNLFVQSPDHIEHLKSQGITHILNVSSENFSKDFEDKFNDSTSPTQKLLHISMKDNSDTIIFKYFSKVFQFIDSVRETENGKILVHCQAGISRSVSMVMAYLIWNRDLVNSKSDNKLDSFDNVLEFVKAIRPIAGPNIDFCLQLQYFLKEVMKGSHCRDLENFCEKLMEVWKPAEKTSD
jgi:predicted protein tyrosine phosphatase